MIRYLIKPSFQNRIVAARRFTTSTNNNNNNNNNNNSNIIVNNDELAVGRHVVLEDPHQKQIKEFLNGVDFKGRPVNIFRPSRNTMQTGTLRTKKWIMEVPFSSKWNDRLMGWWASYDTLNQLNLKFSSEADAVAYCKELGLNYTIIESDVQIKKKKKYGYRFRYKGDLEGAETNEQSIN